MTRYLLSGETVSHLKKNMACWIFEHVRFVGIETKVNFVGAHFYNCEFLDCDLTKFIFDKSLVHRCLFDSFRGIQKMYDAQVYATKFKPCVIRDADYQNTTFAGVDFSECVFNNVKLDGSVFRRGSFRHASFREVDLSAMSLEEGVDMYDLELGDGVIIPDPIQYMNDNFERTEQGYKVWTTEDQINRYVAVNPDITDDYGSGIRIRPEPDAIRDCCGLLKWEDVPSLVVPWACYHNDTEARVRRVLKW